MCSNCGRRLCKVEAGTQVDLEIECPKCGETTLVTVNAEGIFIRPKPIQGKPLKQGV